MPFHKTYDEFCNEMQAVKIIKERIDDDFFLSIILSVAYDRTMSKLKDYYQDDDVRAARWWRDLCVYRHFDLHFSWRSAGTFMRHKYECNEEVASSIFSDLMSICQDGGEVYYKKCMHKFARLFPQYYS